MHSQKRCIALGCALIFLKYKYIFCFAWLVCWVRSCVGTGWAAGSWLTLLFGAWTEPSCKQTVTRCKITDEFRTESDDGKDEGPGSLTHAQDFFSVSFGMNNAGWIITCISSSSRYATTETIEKLQVTHMGKLGGAIALAWDHSSWSDFEVCECSKKLIYTPPTSGQITASRRQGA